MQLALKFLPKGQKPPPGYHKIMDHWVFYVKISLTWKVWFVTGGHLTDPPQTMTYSSVVSRDNVQILLTTAVLNDLGVRFFHIGNSYLNADVDDKVWFYASPEFGPEFAGCVTVQVKDLYGLKSAGASFHKHLAHQMRNENFGSFLADPDTWMRPDVKSNREKYWEYVSTHVDDPMAIIDDCDKIIKGLESIYTFNGVMGLEKPESRYLGATMGMFGVNKPSGGEQEIYPYMSDENCGKR